MSGFNPCVVIGLGGTGQRAVLRLKQRLYADARYSLLAGGNGVEVFGVGERNWIAEKGISFFAVDAAEPDMPVVGESLGLERPSENPIISMEGTKEVLEHIQSTPDKHRDAKFERIREWFPQREANNVAIPWGKLQARGLGQMRWFGRLVLVVNARDENKLERSIDAAIAAAGEHHLGSRLEVFIACSVAGGTGGGLLIDTVMLLNKKFEHARDNVSIVGFLVLPDAFQGVMESDSDSSKTGANGYAALRELNRLMSVPDSVRIPWRDHEVSLGQMALDTCYLLSGERAGGQDVTKSKAFDDHLPVAIGDAIYAHAFPSSGSRISLWEANLVQYLLNKRKDYRFATLGIHTVLYAWDPTMRSLAMRFVGDLAGALTREASGDPKALAKEFLADGRLVGQPLGDGATQSLARLATQGLCEGLPQTGHIDATWLEPSDLNPQATPKPNLDVWPAVNEQGEIGKITTKWENEALAWFVDGRQEPGVNEPGLWLTYFGGPDDKWTEGSESNSLHAYLNRCSDRSLAEWKIKLYDATMHLLNLNGLVGGLKSGIAFVEAVCERIERLDGQLKDFPRDYDLEARRESMESLRSQVANKGPLGFIKSDDAALQSEYVEATQAWITASEAERCLSQAKWLSARFGEVAQALKTSLHGSVSTLQVFTGQAESRRTAIDNARLSEASTSVRSYVPVPKDDAEEYLYRSELGGWDEAASLHKGTAETLGSLTWSWQTWRGEDRILLKGPWGADDSVPRDAEPPELKFDMVLALALDALGGLRTRSVFDVLQADRTAEEAVKTAGDLVRNKWLKQCSPFAHFNQVMQNDAAADGGGGQAKKSIALACAEWLDEGRGKDMSAGIREAVEQSDGKRRVCNLSSMLKVGEQDIEQEVQGAVDTDLPLTDKIIFFEGQHLLRLAAFPAVTRWREAYEEEVCAALKDGQPLPHVLPPEKVACGLEVRSSELEERGVLPERLPEIGPHAIPICGAEDLLVDTAWCAAGRLLDFQVDTSSGDTVFRWVLRTSADGDVGHIAIGNDGVKDLADVLLDLSTEGGRSGGTNVKKTVKMRRASIQEAAKGLRIAHSKSRDSAVAFVGSFTEHEWCPGQASRDSVAAVELLLRTALAAWYLENWGVAD